MTHRLAVAPKGHSAFGLVSSTPCRPPLNAPIKIISGGQTGADRAALDAALKLNIPCGGWCPADRAAEDGILPDRYPLMPLANAGYRQRTRRNVQDTDGTVILSFGPLTGGSRVTAEDCGRCNKPHLLVDGNLTTPGEAAILLAVFLLRHRIHTLNVAGPRASKQPAIYEFVFQTLQHLLATKRKRKSPRKGHEGARRRGPDK